RYSYVLAFRVTDGLGGIQQGGRGTEAPRFGDDGKPVPGAAGDGTDRDAGRDLTGEGDGPGPQLGGQGAGTVPSGGHEPGHGPFLGDPCGQGAQATGHVGGAERTVTVLGGHEHHTGRLGVETFQYAVAPGVPGSLVGQVGRVGAFHPGPGRLGQQCGLTLCGLVQRGDDDQGRARGGTRCPG